MTFNKNDINITDKAKEYSNYYEEVLKPEEKAIFDKGKEKVKVEKMGLSSARHTLLVAIIKEQKSNSIPYQVVNNLNDNKPIDKVITQFENILFSESDLEFEAEIKAKQDKLDAILVNKEKKDKEISEFEIKNNKILNSEFELKAENYKNEVQLAIDKLKRDLNYGNTAVVVPTETGYNSNGKPFTHPLNLGHDLPQQFIKIFKDFDKEKLFKIIKRNFSSIETDFSTSKYLQVGGTDCLPFKSNKSLDQSYNVLWMDADSSIKNSSYLIVSIFEIPLHSEKITLDKNGNLVPTEFWKDSISVFERDKLIYYQKCHCTVDIMAKHYLEHAIELIQNDITAKGTNYDTLLAENKSKEVNAQARIDNIASVQAGLGKLLTEHLLDPATVFDITNYRQELQDFDNKIQGELESVQSKRVLDLVEDNKLREIKKYLSEEQKQPKILLTCSGLKGVLGSSSKFEAKIKAITDRVNAPSSKINKAGLVKYCKETLAKKPDITDVPNDDDDPEVVVETTALHEIKVDSNLKAGILQKMKDYKDGKDNLILLDRTVYGDSQEFSEEGIVKFYTEELGGQDHATKKYQQPFKDNIHEPPF
ncbi:11279_t:CDS:10 [Funneliformis caledonium]|uniref:11279_t:CDS:1 n=1 Tax=Funneliformis caledonium TaxID=1117310 RepID=A0A9N9DLE2_9GLOM|nr:11279_t:CDS:10 [Funneliformis caledonium]